jgi:PiT family inorganic phosphate transporter
MPFLADSLSTTSTVVLFIAVGLALSFEFVNGFHDTANAVATVIYTHTLKPNIAVVWSGIWNLIGALASSGAVAFGIIALLPVEFMLNVGSATSLAMVFALLIAAILWNLGTWSLGLPASSSHALIGSIMGVGLANSLTISGQVFGAGVNWSKAYEIGLSLLISPLVGFFGAALVLLTMKVLIRRPELYQPPDKDKPPPFWIRSLLVLTCTGVSFAHGSNDGQKGMGLIMLILIGIIPANYALRMSATEAQLHEVVAAARSASAFLEKRVPAEPTTGVQATEVLSAFLQQRGALTDKTIPALATETRSIVEKLSPVTSIAQLPPETRRNLRSDFYLVSESIAKLARLGQLTDGPEKAALLGLRSQLDSLTKFIPDWVKYAVALAIGLGTMVGWKRIVVTIGEKIGKQNLTYAQGAAAELVAMTTIGAADMLGLPVSTTHVLSSGVAGTMAANQSGLQLHTVRNLLLAWVLTLPVCVLLGAGLFGFGLFILLNVFGLR